MAKVDWAWRTRQLIFLPPWKWERRRALRVAGYSCLAAGGIMGMAYYWPELSFMAGTVQRNTRMAWTVAQVAWDYRQHYQGRRTTSPKEFDPKRPIVSQPADNNHELHLRSAQRLLRLFQLNGGIYIKIGQHLAALEHLIPVEYCRTMSVLHSHAPASTLEEVEAVVKAELGGRLGDFFVSFDPHPIGAASLAQVHKATVNREGHLIPVAVKVQHACLHGQVNMDLMTVSMAVKAVKWFLPEFTLDWLADEMRTNLPRELDFVQEGMNAERVAKDLRPLFGNLVHIPAVHWDLTRPRVLVMEDVTAAAPCAPVNDLPFLHRQGIRPIEVARRLTEMYSAMIFLRGFVHCDPHPGNIMIRVARTGQTDTNSKWLSWHHWWRKPKWELILLDHGLYRELPDDFRLNYAHLWDALIRGDEAAIKRYCIALGAGDAHRMLSCVLTHRSWTSIAGRTIHEPGTAAELAYLRDRAPELVGMVADLLARLPRPLLLLLKTNDLLRGVERQLMHDNNSGRFSVTILTMARFCQQAIWDENVDNSSWLSRYLRYWWIYLRLSIAEWIY